MFSLDDERWDGLNGGYRQPFDPRPLLKQLESGIDTKQTWHELWEELHHQGDVGEVSYAVVPHLVRIYRQRGVPDFNVYAIIAVIDLARDKEQNPRVPDWLEKDYFEAIKQLADVGIREFVTADEPESIRAILSILAISKGARTYGRMLLDYSQEELREFESSFGL